MSLIWLSAGAGAAAAEEKTAKDQPVAVKQVEAEALDMVSVVGSAEDAKDMPASATYIGTEDIREQSYSDINRILRKAPGVNIREEDGFGLFPNISFRGVDTTRSAKITVMEDGVLVAPAAYSAPAAYYNPAGGRMSGVEVLKGGSQIKYGPHITGGVMNYLSTPIPLEGKAYLKSIYGSYGEFRSHGFVGDTLDTAHGRVGYLVEGFYRGSDGFKTIDSTPDFHNGDQTGFQQVEPMVRLSWEPNTAMYQKLEVKFGYSSMDANETYLGLSEEDFRNDPYRRYSASRFDNIDSQQYGGFARYFISPTNNLDIVTTAYYKEFNRNWSKLQDIRFGGSNRDLARSLAGDFNGQGLACLKGDFACSLRVRDNNRAYYAGGVETMANYRFDSGVIHHELNGGFRYHTDAETRFQHDTRYTQNASGVITNVDVGKPGSQDDRTGETHAYAFFLKDRMEWGKLGFTPGFRYEHLDQVYDDRRTASKMKARTATDLYAGGASVDYKFTDEFMMFASAHRGFSPAGPADAVAQNAQPETSNAYELGGRYKRGAFSAEVTGFYTQFENLLVIESIGGGGSDDFKNFGAVDSRGVEVAMNYDAGEDFGWGFRNPYFVSFTYTDTEQLNNAASKDPESIFSFGKKGNRIPYIPEYTLSFGSGLHFDRWGMEVAANYVSSVFASASNTSEQLDGDGKPNSRFGKTDEYVIVDVSAYYKVAKGVKILGGVQNAGNEEYIVSRQPYGPRPGMPLFAYGGFELDFDI
ncbi:TonB-dependent receptor [Methylomonas sp. SURF-2]|uniref:TonB-dependent receptor n=1 Tax=Methylomonas subterranea TaxID=2952225 RepID=A0ABT1TLG8_9GAMM|nr:TonB-dependent receptor [Methylomonas sp. SURF-2]MCQ8106311.1 TonB-dependent receptor [Methylomonas sp. SURF-2]